MNNLQIQKNEIIKIKEINKENHLYGKSPIWKSNQLGKETK